MMHASTVETPNASGSAATSGTGASRLSPAFLPDLTRLARAAALAASLALTLAAMPMPAQAQTSVTLVSNIGQPLVSASIDDKDYRTQFTTGASTYKLTGVTLVLGQMGTSTVEYRVVVEDETASTSLGRLTAPSSLVGGNNTFTAPGTGIDLAANTTYYVYFNVTAQGNRKGIIALTSGDAEDSGGLPGWSIANTHDVRDWHIAAWSTHTDILKFAIEGYPIPPPAAPTVSSVPLQPDRLAVRWSAPRGATVTDYDVRYYKGSADPADEADWIEADETGGHNHTGTLTAATITGLDPVTTYRVQVRATTAVGTGEWSASGSGRTEALVGAWGSSVEQLVGNTGKTVNGNRSLASLDAAQGFRSARHDLGYTVTDVDLHFSSVPDAGVQVRLATGVSNTSAGTTLATLRNPAALAAGVLTFTAPAGTTLDANTNYYVVVEGAAGSLSWTTSLDERGLLDWHIADIYWTRTASSTGGWTVHLGGSFLIRINGRDNVGDPPGAPGAPTLAVVTASTSVTASWSAPTYTGSGITDYDLRYYEGSADPTDEVDWVEEDETTGLPFVGTADTSTSVTITGLKASTAYRVQVRAESHGAPGPWSDSASVTTNAATDTTNRAPTRAKLGTVSQGCIVDDKNISWKTVTLQNPGTLQSWTGFTATGDCGAVTVRRHPMFLDADGDTMTLTVEAVLPDNVRFVNGTPYINNLSNDDRVFFRGVAAGGPTDVRVNVTAADPHGASADGFFFIKVPSFSDSEAPRFDEMVGTRGFQRNVPIPRWVLPPANGGDTISRNWSGQLPYFYAVSGLPPGLSFDPMTRAITGTPTRNGSYTVTYTADDADDAYSLKDTPTAADLADVARQSFVVEVGAPAIVLVQIVSAPTYDWDGDGGFDTYIAGDEILVDVEFTEPVKVTGTPAMADAKVRVLLDVGGEQRFANLLEDGGMLYGGRRLRFGYTVEGGPQNSACPVPSPNPDNKVVADDCAADGVWVKTKGNDDVVLVPTGLHLVSAESGAAAVRTFSGLPTTGGANAKVDGTMASTDIGPRPESATTDTDGDTVTVTFNRALSTQVDLSGVPLEAYFSVYGAGVVGAGQRGAYQHPSAVTVSGRDLVMELNTPARASDTVTLSYENLGSGVWPLKDQSSPPKRLAGFVDLAVTNKSTGVAGPVPTRASTVGTALALVFDQRLDQDSRPPGSAFTVRATDVDDTVRTIAGNASAVVIDDAKVNVTLTAAVNEGELLTVSYAKPAEAPLRAAVGTPAVASFESFRVEAVHDSTPPTLVGVVYVQHPTHNVHTSWTLYFDEALDTGSVPARADFEVRNGGPVGTNYRSSEHAVANNAVTFRAFGNPSTLWLKYTPPTTGGIRDLAGNRAAKIAGRTVSRSSAGTPGRGPTSYKVNGTLLSFWMGPAALDPTSVPIPEQFTLTYADATDYPNSVTSVLLEPNTVKLHLANPVLPCDGQTPFKLNYTNGVSGSNPLKGLSGGNAGTFTEQSVTNDRHSQCVTRSVSGGPSGSQRPVWEQKSVTLEFDRRLDRTKTLDPADFTLEVPDASGTSAPTVRGASYTEGGTGVTLALSRARNAGETATLGYEWPRSGGGLWDANGNQFDSFSGVEVRGDEAAPVLDVANARADEGGSLAFQVTLDKAAAGGVTVDYATADGTATAGADYTAASGTLTFAAGETAKTVEVAALTDDAAEDDETLTFALSNASGATIGTGSATGTVADVVPLSVLGVADARADEGGTLAFVVTLSEAAAGAVTVDYATADGTASAGADYTAASGTLTFAAGETAKTVEVAALADAAKEDDETLTLTLSNASGATIGTASATGTVANVALADTTPPVPVSAEVDGHIATVTFDKDLAPPASTDWFNFQWTVTGTGVQHHPDQAWMGARTVSMRLARDFPAVAGQTVMLAYEPSDYLKDAAGNQVAFFRMEAKNVTLPVLAVADVPPLPAVRVADARADEGGALAFAVTLNAAAAGAVTVDYATSDGTATAGADYTAASGTLTFAPGESEKTVAVALLHDAALEGDETLTLTLSNPSSATIADREATGTVIDVPPLTATFEDMPEEHDGRRLFHFVLAFSDNFPGRFPYTTLRDDAFTVTNGRVRGAERVVKGENQRWKITVRPASNDDVTITLAAGAVSTESGRPLANTVTATVLGPALLSVADAEADEAEGATLDFAVTLSRAATGTVTVDYATADGTATTGEDYTATSGTLNFAVGETSKAVSVPLLDDAIDEGSETFTLTLSNPTGAQIADGEATGTIKNTDTMPKAWTSRFGRTVAVHVVDALEARLEGASDSWMQLGGHRLGGAPEVTETAQRLAPEFDLWAEAEEADPAEQAVTFRDLLMGSAFHLVSEPGEQASGPLLSAWGRVATSGFDGQEDLLSMNGSVTTGALGVDAVWERWLTGLLVAYSEGEGSFTHVDLPDGDVESSLTSVHPYVAYTLSDRVRLWGMVGYGSGALRLRLEDERAMDTDLSMTMGALGVRGDVLRPVFGVQLALRSDVLWMGMDSAKADNLAATTAEASRLRLVLEGSRPVALRGGGSFTPSLEVGLRHDGGDAETGTGVEVGGSLRYASAWGLSIEASLRGLVAHEAADYTEWGASGALRFDPGRQGKGLTAAILPTWGMAASGVENLWGQTDTRALAPAGGLPAASVPARLDAELGYGLVTFRGRGLLTPYARVALVESAEQAWHVGTRLALRESLNLSLEASRRAMDGQTAAHEVALQATLGW